MKIPKTPGRTALIVHAHPEPHSFCTAQMHAAAQALEAQDYTVEIVDLYVTGWNPVLDRAEFALPEAEYFKPQAEQFRALQEGTLSPELQAQLDRLRQADLLVLSFPLWWFSLPAILKGWIDRVFVMGGLFGGPFSHFAGGAMTGKRATLLLTTGGSDLSFTRGAEGQYGDLNDFLYHVHHGMLRFVGYTVLTPVVTHRPARLTPQEREDALGRVRQSFTLLDEWPELPS